MILKINSILSKRRGSMIKRPFLMVKKNKRENIKKNKIQKYSITLFNIHKLLADLYFLFYV
jgi:hypothetical protein